MKKQELKNGFYATPLANGSKENEILVKYKSSIYKIHKDGTYFKLDYPLTNQISDPKTLYLGQNLTPSYKEFENGWKNLKVELNID